MSGTCTGAAAGDTVTITLNGKTYTTILDASGAWSVGVPAADITTLGNGQSYAVDVTVTDKAGNSSSESRDISVVTDSQTLVIDPIAQDNVLNAVEKGEALTVSGNVGASSLTAGDTVTVTLNGKNYDATVNADGTWRVSVPPADLALLGEANYTVTASATNGEGNAVNGSASLLVDTVLPTITLNPVTSDDVLNLAEVNSGQTLSGKVSGAAPDDIVTIVLGGQTYTTTVNADGTWSVSVDSDALKALGDGSITVNVSVTNGHGNTGTGSRDFTIDADLPGLRIDTVAGDDIVNAIEHQQPVVISGTSSDVPAGNVVTVTVNGVSYPATVGQDGTWSVSVPAADVSAWPAGTLTITAEAANASGNASDIGHVVKVDLSDVAVSINTVALDNVINATEKGADLVLNGATQNVEAGQVVKVVFAGHSYDAVVQADGSWSITVPAADMAGLREGADQVQVSVVNQAGNTASAAQELVVDTTAPTLTIDPVAGDNILNAAEHGQALTLTGTSNAEAGQTVTVTVNGADYTTTVNADGTWSVSGVDASGLADGTHTITASVSDKAGNPSDAGREVLVDVTVPVITINTIAGDDIINAAEHGQAQLISGTCTGAAAGDTVTITLNGKTYTTILDANGAWSVGVPAADITALGNGQSYAVDVTVTDKAGNSSSESRDISVNTSPIALTIDAIAVDDIINAAEAGQPLVLSGTANALPENTVVTVTLNGKTYSATVTNSGTWTLTVDQADVAALADGNYTVTASAVDAAGNHTNASHNVTVDTTAPTLTINDMAHGNVLNGTTAGEALVISGSTSAEPGQLVTVELGSNTYSATVSADGTWTLTVPPADLALLNDGDLTVTASVTDKAGNPVQADHGLTLDTRAPTLSINTIAGDDIVNLEEQQSAQIISGHTDAEPGQTVIVTFNDRTYSATVDSNGDWQVSVPAKDFLGSVGGQYSVSATVTDKAGNSVTADKSITLSGEAPTITIDTVAGDDIINAAEHGAPVVLSGTSNVTSGQVVTITLGSQTYSTTVDASGKWSYTLDASVVQALTDGNYTLSVSVADTVGNATSADKALVVDTLAPQVTINKIAGDNIINAGEHGQAQIISGTCVGAAAGDKVTVTLNGKDYTTAVNADGTWNVGIPAAAIGELIDGDYIVTVSVTDKAGNTGSQTQGVEVNTAAVALTIDAIAVDDIINAAEAGQPLVLSGTASDLPENTVVTVTLNGKTYSATVTDSGTWTLTVDQADVAALADGNYTVTASAIDAAGNHANASHNVTVDTTAPTLTINDMAHGNVLNGTTAGEALVISGSTSAQAGQVVTVALGDNTYSATVSADGTWTLTVPPADLALLNDGDLTVTASVTDKAGNPVQADHGLTLDTRAPTLSINTIAGDDVVNSTEQQAGQIISGRTDAEPGQTVIVTFNDRTYSATVDSNGDWQVSVPAKDFLGAADGQYSVSATVTDKAGNSVTTDKPITLNGEVPTIVIDTIAGDDVINAAEHGGAVVLSGTSNAIGQTVTITLNGQTYTTTVGADGKWSHTLSTADVQALADGQSYVVNASVSNSIGNSVSDTHTVSVDTTAPQMSIAIDSVVNDTGLSSSDFVINHANVTLKGSLGATLGADEKAQISLDGGTTWIDLVVNGTGWSYTDGRTLADNAYDYTVRVIDAAGNVGATADQTVVIDTVAPDAAVKTITIDAINTDTGLSNSDFVTSDNSLAIRGQLGAALAADEHAQISIDGGVTWIDVEVSGLNWTYVDTRSLADGKYNYMVRVVDQAGNVGATASQVVTVDTVAPDAAKTITIDGISDDTGLSNSDFVTRDTSLTLRGTLGETLMAGEHAQISLDGGLTWQDVVVIGTGWTFTDTRSLIDGTYTYHVRVVDQAGNVGQVAQKDVVIDTVSPESAKGIAITAISNDTGLDNNDFITSDITLTIKGTLGALLANDEYAQISVDGGVTWTTVVVDASGLNWSYTDGRTLTEGSHEYRVRVVDLAGNVGETSSQVVLIDTTASAETITVDSISEDTGRSASDFITSDTSLTVKGSLGNPLAADEFVQVSVDNGATWQFASVSGTQWTFVDGRTLTDGNHVYQVRIIDTAGNTGTVVSQTVVVDTLDPIAEPGIASYSDNVGDRTGTFDASYITDDTSPLLNGVLSGPLADGEIVQVYRNGILLGVATMTGSMTWTYQDSGLTDATYTYTAQVVDLAGNVTKSSDFVLNVDTSIPDTRVQIATVVTDDKTPIAHGTLSKELVDGQILVVTINGIEYSSDSHASDRVVVDPLNNTWYVQIADNDALQAGKYDVSAQVISAAGNGNQNGLTTVTDALQITNTTVTADWGTNAGLAYTNGMSYTLDANGMWNIAANGTAYFAQDISSYSGTKLDQAATHTASAYYPISLTWADYARSGYAGLFATENIYTNNFQEMWIQDADGTFTPMQLGNVNSDTSIMKPGSTNATATWYGAIVSIDLNGDGYADIIWGDGTPDSTVPWMLNNGDGSYSIFSATTSLATAGGTSRNQSGVDLNNDGSVDVVQQVGAYNLRTVINNGNGTITAGQTMTNMFGVSGAANTNNNGAVSMTWADFNGDGYLDLYVANYYSNTTQGGLLWNTNGTLSTTFTKVGATFGGSFSLAVDWNHDGAMDIVKFADTAASAVVNLNNGNGSNWAPTTISTGTDTTRVTGVASIDYNWDGATDLLVSRQSGKMSLVLNTNKVEDKTSLVVKILDAEGINSFYGNTVRLYDSQDRLVSTQMINAQSGFGSNDSSGLVYFYGLSATEQYRVELVRAVNGVAHNENWGGLTTQNANESYVLTTDVINSQSLKGTITGTGYNDRFIVEENSNYVYNGGGGTEVWSNNSQWSATGGVDTVDFIKSTVGVTADLSKTSGQNTGFNTSTFQNIEGLAGSHFADTLSAGNGNHFIEGRGGDDIINLGTGVGHATVLFKMIDASNATGGNGADTVNGFTLGTWEGTKDTDRIDIRELLQGSGYTGNAKASYVNGVAQMDSSSDNIGDFVKVTTSGSDTVIQIDRDGSGGSFSPTTVVTLTGVNTDLATLLANHQLLVV
nr:Ig-like domain-containing protein [Enterobacillus tribolii]